MCLSRGLSLCHRGGGGHCIYETSAIAVPTREGRLDYNARLQFIMLCVYGAVCDTALSRRELTDFPLVDEKPVFALLTTLKKKNCAL